MSNINDEKPLAFIITGNLNARSNNWCSQDIIKNQRSITYTLTSTSGYHQLINFPPDMANTISACIDLMFYFKPKFHHRIWYSKIYLCR